MITTATADPSASVNDEKTSLADDYARVRLQTEQLCHPLEIEDYGVQSIAATSPPKWHLAHTAWFFETLLLKPFLSGYNEYHPLFSQLFNSYYDSIGHYFPQSQRGLLSRPTVAEIYQYRRAVDEQMVNLLSQQQHSQRHIIVKRTILGLNHEQQHQELILMDIKHNFFINPLRPVYQQPSYHFSAPAQKIQWLPFEGGVSTLGHEGPGFVYDNETPRHKIYVNPFRLASRPVINSEYIDFIQTGAYDNSDLWYADAWKKIQQQQWLAPLYWQQIEGDWWHMTLSGMSRVDLNAPVCHISFYEASAYARWKNKRLPSEAEWEMAVKNIPITGNLYSSKHLQPRAPALKKDNISLQQMFGDVWEWTQSAYAAYPGYRQEQGTLGEYNGKFMSNQMVLRGGCCVSPDDHIRPTYRNFFYPHDRWQFSGFRLAEDAL